VWNKFAAAVAADTASMLAGGKAHRRGDRSDRAAAVDRDRLAVKVDRRLR
jgi:hypothetical protein